MRAIRLILPLLAAQILLGCQPEEPPPPDPEDVIREFCEVFMACEPSSTYETPEDCEFAFLQIHEADDAGCKAVRLEYESCLAGLTCEEYLAINSRPDKGQTCYEEMLSYGDECLF